MSTATPGQCPPPAAIGGLAGTRTWTKLCSCGLLVASTLALWTLAAPASAAPESTRTSTVPTTLRGRLGVGSTEPLLASAMAEDRIRGLERLGATATARAIDRLIRALAPGGSATTPEERLTAVRELSPQTRDPSVRRALARVLGGHATPSGAEPPGALDDLAQATAGLALARQGGADALAALGKALEAPGRAARAATDALVAYPPRDLTPLLAAARAPTLELAVALDSLGDERAFDALRTLVRRGTPPVRARAAIALTRLGDYETVALARRWTAAAEPAVLRVAAARILALSHANDTSAAIARLLDDPATRSDALALALDAPHPSLAPTLARLLAPTNGERSPELVAALGRAGGPLAADALASLLGDRILGGPAASALARMPDAAAAAVLVRALHQPPVRRLAARAAAVRALVLSEVIDGLEPALKALLASKDAGDRAAGAFGLGALEPGQVTRWLTARDDAVATSVAGLALVAPAETLRVAADELARADHTARRTSLAIALASPSARDRVPTPVLEALLETGSAAAPLAALALASRDEGHLRERVGELLASDDPWIRSHTALGLGFSREADATGRLSLAYRFESEPVVRAAIVRALSLRPAAGRSRALELAAGLDPDATVRALARLASAGAALDGAPHGEAVAWVPIVTSQRDDAPSGTAIAIATVGGFVLPAVAGADGSVLVAGLPNGPIEVRVAPADGRSNDPGR